MVGMGLVELVSGRCVHWGAPWASGIVGFFLGVVGVAGLILVGPAGRGFFRGLWVHVEAPWRRAPWGSTGSFVVAGFIGVFPGRRQLVRSVHWGAPSGWSGSFGVDGLIGVHHGDRRVRLWSLD